LSIGAGEIDKDPAIGGELLNLCQVTMQLVFLILQGFLLLLGQVFLLLQGIKLLESASDLHPFGGFLFHLVALLRWRLVGVGASELGHKEVNILLIGNFTAIKELLTDFLPNLLVQLVGAALARLIL
jgi:hypothetical protein